MNEIDNLYFAVTVLWIAAMVCFILKWFKYLVAADLGMALVLMCFTALVIHRSAFMPGITPAATAAPPAAVQYVTLEGDDSYHLPGCERLLGRVTAPYGERRDLEPCVDCVLPQRHRREALLAGQPK